MAPTSTETTITIMLFEGGALIEALSDKPQGAALARKIEDADLDALAAGKTEFDIAFTPIEVGMAFEAVSGSNSLLSTSLTGKLREALKAKLEELGVAYDGVPSAGGDAPSPDGDGTASEDQPADDGTTYSDTDGQDSL